jgi:hypothetical protein
MIDSGKRIHTQEPYSIPGSTLHIGYRIKGKQNSTIFTEITNLNENDLIYEHWKSVDLVNTLERMKANNVSSHYLQPTAAIPRTCNCWVART